MDAVLTRVFINVGLKLSNIRINSFVADVNILTIKFSFSLLSSANVEQLQTA